MRALTVALLLVAATVAVADSARLMALDPQRVWQAANQLIERWAPAGEARIVDLRPPLTPVVPSSDYTVEAEAPAEGLHAGIVRLPLVVRPAGGPEQRLAATATLEVQQSMAVATRDIQRGERLRPGDLRVETRPTTVRGRWITEPGDAAGLVARATLRRGEPAPLTAVGRAAPVEPGQPVRAWLRQGVVQLELRTIARGRGELGAIVPIAAPDGRRLIRARVVAPGQVVVVGSQEIEPTPDAAGGDLGRGAEDGS